MIADDASSGRAIGMAREGETVVARAMAVSAKANFFNTIFSPYLDWRSLANACVWTTSSEGT
jgi:hypothetical protein